MLAETPGISSNSVLETWTPVVTSINEIEMLGFLCNKKERNQKLKKVVMLERTNYL